MKVRTIALILAMAAGVAGVCWLATRPGKPAEEPVPARDVTKKKIPAPAAEKTKAKVEGETVAKKKKKAKKFKRGKDLVRGRKAVVKRPAFDDLEGEGFSETEKKLAKKIGDALASDDFKRVAACVEEAAASEHAEVRSRMVGALQWFGRKAMPELTMFMADSDDDVRQEALDAWLDAVQEVESPTEKRDLVVASVKTMNDRGAVEAMVNEVADLPNTYQVTVLSELIQTGNSVVQSAAREQYEFLTDEKYTDESAAAKWLQENPDDEVEVEDVFEKDAAEGVVTPVAE